MSESAQGEQHARAINIGPREERKRRLMGIVALTAGVSLSFMMVVFEAPRWSRLLVFLPVWIAGLGLFQAREKICIALAARGTRNMDTGEEPIADEKLRAELRACALKINRRALLTAAVITLVAVAFPWG